MPLYIRRKGERQYITEIYYDKQKERLEERVLGIPFEEIQDYFRNIGVWLINIELDFLSMNGGHINQMFRYHTDYGENLCKNTRNPPRPHLISFTI